MTRARFLGLCFLISVFAHLFWLVAFQIVVMPSERGGEGFPQVSFLGPVLEKITFRSEPLTEKGIFAKKHLLKDGDELALNLEEIIFPNSSAKEKIIPLEKKTFLPPLPLKEEKKIERVSSYRGDFPALRRHLIYRPELPFYSGEEISGSVGLRFLVNPEGRVEMIEIIQTSSHPQLDFFAKRHLKSWIFAGLPAENKASRQWEEVKLNLRMGDR